MFTTLKVQDKKVIDSRAYHKMQATSPDAFKAVTYIRNEDLE